jgi:hypothetical protein
MSSGARSCTGRRARSPSSWIPSGMARDSAGAIRTRHTYGMATRPPSALQNACAFVGTNPRKCSERFRNQRIGVLRPSGSRRLDWQRLDGLPFLIAATVTPRASVPFSNPTPELSGLRGLLGGPRQDRSEWLMRNTEQNGAALSCRSGRRIGSRFFVQFVQSRQPVQRRNSCGNSGANVYCRHLDGRRN